MANNISFTEMSDKDGGSRKTFSQMVQASTFPFQWGPYRGKSLRSVLEDLNWLPFEKANVFSSLGFIMFLLLYAFKKNCSTYFKF